MIRTGAYLVKQDRSSITIPCSSNRKLRGACRNIRYLTNKTAIANFQRDSHYKLTSIPLPCKAQGLPKTRILNGRGKRELWLVVAVVGGAGCSDDGHSFGGGGNKVSITCVGFQLFEPFVHLLPYKVVFQSKRPCTSSGEACGKQH